jgi:hypothetical protein
MHRLIKNGLMFGNLFHVDSPVLVDRYNRALKHLTGKETKLTDFHVDIAGFSPEVGEDLGDMLYLNHNGVNRQFILLSTTQKTAPLLDAKFSNSRSILRQFIETNESQLFALTARDAVAGELINSVFSVADPAKLLDIRRIEIEADTTTGLVEDAETLGQLSDRFLTEEDAWFDDVLIADMITTAKRTGDVTRNPVRLKQMSFVQENFWTDHFGGTYVFRGAEKPAILTAEVEAFKSAGIKDALDKSDSNKVARFLRDNNLAEPIVKARGIDATAILRQKMDFIVVDTAQDAGADLTGATRRDIRALARRHAEDLPPEYHALRRLLAWAEDDGPWPKISSEHPAYFYTLRAAAGPDADLVNMLLAELAPKDVRQLFICHKSLFYSLYAGWNDSKRGYVADFLAREYLVDKVGARNALFGHEPGMDEPAETAKPDPQDYTDAMIARVGPWGAVLKGRK